MHLIRLTRPVDFPLFLLVVLLGGWLAAGTEAFVQPHLWSIVCAALSAAFVGAAANVINDVYDVEIDRENRPDRPLAAGLVAPRSAWILWAVLSTAGILTAFGASAAHGAIAAASTALLWAYAARLKRVPGLGHALVGAVVGLGVLFGAMAYAPAAAGNRLVVAGAMLAFLLVSVREIVKAIPDVAGDAAQGAATLPVVAGVRTAASVALAGLGSALASLPWFTAAGYAPLFLAYAIPMAGLILGAAWHLLAADSMGPLRPKRWGTFAARSSAWLKAALAAGVVALALGR